MNSNGSGGNAVRLRVSVFWELELCWGSLPGVGVGGSSVGGTCGARAADFHGEI